jgi:hypothetical protein
VSAEQLDNMIQSKHFDRAGPAAVDLLRSLKPYHNGNAALRVIHDLDIRDKHRALIPNVIGVASPIVKLCDDEGTFNPRVIGNPNEPSKIRLVFPNEAGPEGRELIPTLHGLVQHVEVIVEAFRALANRDDPGL